MRIRVFFVIGIIFISSAQIFAQQDAAFTYWKMENDPTYVALKQKQDAGEPLSPEEQSRMTEYKTRLNDFFSKMSDDEKASYYKNRANWSSHPGTINHKQMTQDTDVFSGQRSMFTQYLITNGLFGFGYGLSAAFIFDAESGGAAIGVPLLAAGVSTLVPILTLKDKIVTNNSLVLSRHGKAMGFVQGAALSLLITGNNVEEGKFLLTLGTVSSIGLGHLGYWLGREKEWSPGRVALYAHYGSLMPFEGLALDAAFKFEDPRVYAATSLAFGAGGYIIADLIADRNDFTKGDIISTQTLTTMNGLFGLFLSADINKESDFQSSDFLMPAAGALAGSLISHAWLKDAHLTTQQGRNTALAASGGAVIGLGLAAIINADTPTPYYLIPYITGMSSYALIVNRYKKNNQQFKSTVHEKAGGWKFNLMPQNIILNREIANKMPLHPGKKPVFLPAFTASVNF